MKIIKGENFVLREPRLFDIDNLVEYTNHKDVIVGARLEKGMDKVSAKEWIEKVILSNSKNKGLRMVIETKDGVIGGVTFKDFKDEESELGYWLARPFWGKGIMSKAVKMFVKFGFEKYNLRLVYALASDSNPASVRVLEKAGFIRNDEMDKRFPNCCKFVIEKQK